MAFCWAAYLLIRSHWSILAASRFILTVQASRTTLRGDAIGAVSGGGPLRRWLGGSTQSLALAGAELGVWNFLASSFQAIGLEITSATRASFLIQACACVACICGLRLAPLAQGNTPAQACCR